MSFSETEAITETYSRQTAESHFMKIPRHKREGFLYSDTTSKANAEIEFTVRMPKNPASFAPVLVVGGFQGIKPVYGNFRDALAYTLDRPVASFRRPRTEKYLHQAMTPDKLLHPAKLAPQTVVAMIDLLHERFGQQVTVIGHSMGGPNSIDGALRRKDEVSQVILMASGGLERGQNSLRMARRFPEIARDEIFPATRHLAGPDIIKLAYESAYYTMRHPWRTWGEAMDVSNRQLMSREIAELHDSGIQVHAAQMEHDRFFPLSHAVRDAQSLVDSFGVLESANHMSPVTQPQRVASFIGSIILPEHAVAA